MKYIKVSTNPANKFPGDFQDTFNKVTADFYIDRAS